MELTNAKIIEKLSKANSFLYQSSNSTNDYNLDYNKLWIPHSEFLALQQTFPYLSSQTLISGILFSKSKKPEKSQWFKAKFYCLCKDHMILYSVIKKIKFSQ